MRTFVPTRVVVAVRYSLADHRNCRAPFDFTRCPLRTNDVAAEHCVKGWCVFSELTYVKPSKLCPPDKTHEFFVGSVPIAVCVAFSSLMRKLEVSIDDINEAIQPFQYGKLRQKKQIWFNHLEKSSLKKKLILGCRDKMDSHWLHHIIHNTFELAIQYWNNKFQLWKSNKS